MSKRKLLDSTAMPKIEDDSNGAPGTSPAPEPESRIPPEPPPETYAAMPTDAELAADEAEFRAMRRDMDGVKDTAAVGIVTVNVGKGPPRNEFFRTHTTFRPVFSMVNIEKGMEKQFFAVAPNMVQPLLEIGISVTDHVLYLTVTSGGAMTVVPVRQAVGDNEQNEYDRTKEIGLRQARTAWVRLYTDQVNRCYKVFPAIEGRFTDPVWPEIAAAKIFRLAFRDKGRLIDSVDHALFQKWASRDRDSDSK
jgi:hypothetical protein